jgi:hypothetical protein
MGRKVNARQGEYDADTTAILRIAKAISQDNTVTLTWRESVSSKLRDAAMLLMTPERKK